MSNKIPYNVDSCSSNVIRDEQDSKGQQFDINAKNDAKEKTQYQVKDSRFKASRSPTKSTNGSEEDINESG